ncbi:hypothetical protein Leucomu_13045 [Leucobacter muris]|uniref:Uncharacterized protein n=1 Tax=Leucobacter muris TaxID=1935379 RepID=A0ABX5QHZ8_9MICO|nr:hypothetical protein [Leucobacter muris]QAB18712.1 hypothetical protein Leucomu_13045 [Leucobacter muris]
MAIRESIVIDIAEVQVTDECQVELRQEKKRTTYSSEQARDLALELVEAAEAADRAIAEDMAERGLRMVHGMVVAEGGEVVL